MGPYRQSNMTKLEHLLTRVMPVAERITRELKVGMQDELKTVSLTRGIIYRNGSCELFEQYPFNIPASVNFTQSYERIYALLEKVGKEYELLLQPVFTIPKPHHACYFPALSIYDGDHEMLASIGPSYSLLGFHPVPQVEGARTGEGVKFYTVPGQQLLNSPVHVENDLLGSGALTDFMNALH